MSPGEWVTSTSSDTSHAVWTVRHDRVLSWCLDVHLAIGNLREQVDSDLVCRACRDAMEQRWAA